MSESLGTAVLDLEADGSKLDKGLRDAEKGALAAMDRVGGKMKSAGKGLTAAVTLPIVGIGGAALKASTDFNALMANVAALGLPAERVNELKKNVQDLAVATGKSTDDLAEGLYNVVSAFGDTADTATILDTNARAAAAGLATTGEAIDLTSAVTKAYGDTSAEAVDHVANLALKTVEMGQTTFPELAGSIGKVTPLAKELNVSQEELFGTMATFTGVTGGAAEVSTQMRGAMQALMAPTESMAELIAELGYESGAAMIEGEGFQGSLAAVTAAAEASGTPLKDYIGSIEGQTLALAGAGDLADDWTEKSAAMVGAAGTLDAAFAAQTEGINKAGFAMAQARQRGAVLAQNMGDALAPMLLKVMDAAEPLVNAIQRAVDWFTNLDPRVQTIIIAIVGLVAAIGPLLWILGSLISMAATVGTAITALGPVFAVLTGPIGLVIAAVAALIAIGILVWKNWDTIVAALSKAWEWVKAKALAIWGAIVGAFQRWLAEIKREFQVAWDWVKNLLSTIWDVIKAAAAAVFDAIKAYFTAVLNAYKTVFTTIWQAIVAVVTGLWNNLKDGATAVFNAIKAIITGVLDGIRLIFDNTFGTLLRIAGTICAAIRGVVTDFMAAVKGVFSGDLDAVVTFFTNLPERILGALGDVGRLLFDAGRNIVQGLIDGIKAMVGKVGDAIGSVASKVRNALPFSPAKEGPLSGKGSPYLAGEKISRMLADGMTNVDISPQVGAVTAKLLPDVGGAELAGAGMPSELVVVDADGALIGRMRVEADQRITKSFAPLRQAVRAH